MSFISGKILRPFSAPANTPSPVFSARRKENKTNLNNNNRQRNSSKNPVLQYFPLTLAPRHAPQQKAGTICKESSCSCGGQQPGRCHSAASPGRSGPEVRAGPPCLLHPPSLSGSGQAQSGFLVALSWDKKVQQNTNKTAASCKTRISRRLCCEERCTEPTLTPGTGTRLGERHPLILHPYPLTNDGRYRAIWKAWSHRRASPTSPLPSFLEAAVSAWLHKSREVRSDRPAEPAHWELLSLCLWRLSSNSHSVACSVIKKTTIRNNQ